ncbi:MAG: chemotaxis protein, partial [Halomonas sp.]|nr:chemotaxis protein [Halomonas sp.]
MTQQNAAMVEESTTAAADMRRHAEHLRELINSFVLGDGEPTQRRQALPATASVPATSSLKRPAPSSKPTATSGGDNWEEF